jgi:RNA polymerase sigma-70 factor (ECF subfamily)
MKFDRTSLNNLFHYCLALCGQRDDALDLLQDSVENYLSKTKSTIENPQAFIKRIARNRFFDLQRRRKIIQFDVLEDIDEGLADEKDLESMLVDSLTLRQVWFLLSAAEREVVFLWAVEDLSSSEIAAQLEIPRATVLARLRRLRLRMEKTVTPMAQGGNREH